ALALSLALSANAALADVMLTVNINTAGYKSSTGFLDFQFNGTGSEPPATATMSQLNGFDLSNFAIWGGDVHAGAGSFTFDNTAGPNELAYQAAFGGVFSFNLTISGVDAIDKSSSRFSVMAWDDQGQALAGDAFGTLMTVDWTKVGNGPNAVLA